MAESDDEQESPIDGTHETWTHSVDAKTAPDLISRIDEKRSKVSNAH